VDWEVVIKAAERGHSASPSFPYALASFDTISDVHGHHEHEILTFAIGAHGLNNLINDLEALKIQLERVSGKLPESTDNLGDNDA
jgi:hypothetical protein